MSENANAENLYLYGWAPTDEIREYRRQHKSAKKYDKRTELKEAIKNYVNQGDYIVFSGLGSVRNPMAAVYEIIRQNIGDLTVAAKGSQHDWQLLAAAGLITKAEIAYGFGDEVRGLCPASRRAVNNGSLKILSEMTNAGFQWRFSAAARGISFFPTRTALGTDTLHYSGAKVIEDPFSGEKINLLPACYPDIAIIHVHRADKYGNCQIDGNITLDVDLAHAAKKVIVTAEKIVPEEEIQKRPDLTKIPFFVVDAVVEVPYGSHPNQVPYLYSFDEEHWMKWLKASASDEGVQQYLDEFIRSTKDHYEYLEKIGGIRKLRELENIENRTIPHPTVSTRGALK
ncbi:CoA transferase subunit A [Calidifontibacillus erzurumensis]|uniref:CoA transferase subunit A n=1 Tax=Calidifontibacillus erzurumensis TaxID=2741433 RepID=UPI0035B5249E